MDNQNEFEDDQGDFGNEDEGNGFETCSVVFRMTGRGGSEHVLNTGTRKFVTPPEFKILQAIHGAKNVQVQDLTGKAMEHDGFDDQGKELKRIRKHSEEVDRLRSWYGGVMAKVKIWDPENPRLPFTFREAGINTKKKNNVSNLKDIDDKKKSASSGGQQGHGSGQQGGISK